MAAMYGIGPVSLWGKDWSKPKFKYPYGPNDSRENTNAENDILRVLRGASWDLDRFFVRCSFRF
jgi:formylglycine-generating enzyme required for sulfatase activity